MTFNPTGNQNISLAGRAYRVEARKGQLANLPVRFVGGRATVFRLIDETSGRLYALKVMREAFRDPELIRNRPILKQLGGVAGFEACASTYLTPEDHAADLAQYPDLTYANLMPWITGLTWNQHVNEGRELTEDESWALAFDFAVTARVLERNEITHGDISGGNVIVQQDKTTGRRHICLIDFDEVFWPGAPTLKQVAVGTPGYRKDGHNQFGPGGDRFAAAVLIAEILGWRDSSVRAHSSANSFFDPGDCENADSERYRILQQFLEGLSPPLGSLFESAWRAPTITECPSIAAWRTALLTAQGQPFDPVDLRDRVKLVLPPPVVSPPVNRSRIISPPGGRSSIFSPLDDPSPINVPSSQPIKRIVSQALGVVILLAIVALVIIFIYVKAKQNGG